MTVNLNNRKHTSNLDNHEHYYIKSKLQVLSTDHFPQFVECTEATISDDSKSRQPVARKTKLIYKIYFFTNKIQKAQLPDLQIN